MINALYYTDFLYRPRRPEELDTAQGGGVVWSQAAHQVDIVRLLGGGRATSVRALTGAGIRRATTEGAYAALLTFDGGAFASLTYSGYGAFRLRRILRRHRRARAAQGSPRNYGAARRALRAAPDAAAEVALKNARNYGGSAYRAAPRSRPGDAAPQHEHFGTFIVSCERARPASAAARRDGLRRRRARGSSRCRRPRCRASRSSTSWSDAIATRRAALHDGRGRMATLEVCVAMLESRAKRRRGRACASQVSRRGARRR